MLHETALVDLHREWGAKLVDFGGWNMPLHYGSQMEEHKCVRDSAGLFDVSHMTVIDISGKDAKVFLQYLLANDVAKLKVEGKALYSAMLNEHGGVIDDLIVYLRADGYRLVVNCGTREKDLAWISKQVDRFEVNIYEREDLAILAVQGPKARALADQVLAKNTDISALADLSVFQARELEYGGETVFVARTGYTGEDGYELVLPSSIVLGFARELAEAGIRPCGLGARDTLRLEAGMNLYGHEMDDDTSPLVANMAWTLAFEPGSRAFIGRAALESELEQGVNQKLVGLVLKGKGVLRAGQHVVQSGSEAHGVITSGTFSPSLGISIALASVPLSFEGDCDVIIRDKAQAVSQVKPCFVRNGKQVF